jgi:integrase
MALTDAACRAAKPTLSKNGKPTNNRLSAGGNLYLVVRPTGAKQWFYIYKFGASRPEMVLGTYPEMGLAAARAEVVRWADVLAAGKNPLAERKAAAALAVPVNPNLTFGQFAEQEIDTLCGAGDRTRAQFLAMMQKFVGPMAKLPPASITKYHVRDALAPYWHARPHTGKKMRQHIFRVLTRAAAFDMIPEPWHNPAEVELVKAMLNKQKFAPLKRRPSLPYAEMKAFMVELRKVHTVWGFAAEFTILTLARSKESRGLIAGEIDFEKKIWTCPASRMKMKEPHRVPLCDAAIALLKRLGVDKMPKDRAVFRNPYTRAAVKGDAITDVITEIAGRDEAGVARATLHGFRRTFRNWVKHAPDYRREFAELCLAHRIGTDVEGHYWDDDALDERRLIMDAWGSYLASNVTDLGGRLAA